MLEEFLTQSLARLLVLMFTLTPFWLAPGLGYIFIRLWIYYRRAEYLAGRKNVMLEIKIPREVRKTPLAMEIVFSGLFKTIGESNWYSYWVLGKVRSDYSFEIVSIEGAVHFFARVPINDRRILETQIYSQYPGAEIYEVPDYTEFVPYEEQGSEWNLFGAEFILSKPDPYPIKTYVDYKLESGAKEEEKVDPITSVIEYLGGLKQGEQAWVQILARANKGAKEKTSLWSRDWQKEGKQLIEEIVAKSRERSAHPATQPEQAEFLGFPLLTEGERETIKAIDRSIGKLGFDCGMRAIYIARRDAYNPGHISGLFGTVKQYNSNTLNGFTPRMLTAYDYPWEEYINVGDLGFASRPITLKKGLRMSRIKWKLFDAYRRRSWFFPPYARKPYVLNTEELATIYHFPGGVSETPTFSRIESKKVEPPTTLPT